MVRMIFRLARRGAWVGVRRVAGVLIYGLTHRRCKRCRKVKGLNAHSLCYQCQWENFTRCMAEDVEDATDREERS
jgi:hypothetical protein